MIEDGELKVDQFIRDANDELTDDERTHGEYCVLVHIGHKRAALIYRDLAEFKKKSLIDIEHIDEMHRIDFETYILIKFNHEIPYNSINPFHWYLCILCWLRYVCYWILVESIYRFWFSYSS